MAEPQWFEPEGIDDRLLAPIRHAPTPPSALGTFGRRAGLATGPTAAGVAAFPAGAAAGLAIGGPIGSLVGGLGSSIIAAYGAERVQNWALDQLDEGSRKTLGIDAETLAAGDAANPTASFLGGVLPQMLFMRPGWNGGIAAASGAAIGAGVEAGSELASEGRIDPFRVATQGALGGLLGRNTRLGDAAMAPAHALVRSIPRGSGGTTAGIAARETIAATPGGLPEAHLAPDERAAMHVDEAEAVVRRSNPFDGAAGAAAHAERIAEATAAAAEGRPSRVAAMPAPMDRTAATKASIAKYESGGFYHAKNGVSTAHGKYQFIDSTWLSLGKQIFPGKTKPEIMAMRNSAAAQERFMDVALAGYERTYRKAGITPTPADLYLMHAVGPKAVRLARASGDEPIASFMSAAELAANKSWLKGTVADVRRVFARRTGDAPTELAAADSAPSPDIAPVLRDPGTFDPLPLLPVMRDYVRGGRGSLTAERVATELGVKPGEARQVMALLAAAPDSGVTLGRSGSLRRIATRRGPADLLTQLADAGGIADDEGHGLLGGRNLQAMIPGAGPLIRRTGMSIDAAGEWLTERGWFAERPATSDVLELLDRAKSEKVYHPDDAEAVATAERQAASEAAEEAAADSIAERVATLRERGEPIAWGEAEQTAAMRHMAAGEDSATAVKRALAPPREVTPFDDDFVPGFDAYPRDVADGAFDDPVGTAVQQQIDGIEHDLRMEMAEPDFASYLDENGDVVNVADMLAMFDDEAGGITGLRACLKPGGDNVA